MTISSKTHKSFDLKFDNRFINHLPGDPEMDNFRRQVYEACYSFVEPRKVSAPLTIAYSPEIATELGITPEECESPEFAQIFSGNQLLSGMQPIAHCYGGHQFGHWAGQLGDGRAINLGEVLTDAGKHYTVQLKGAGLTPYSRSADGLAVLRSSVREFLCSEAMYHLGVPTTRALSLVLSGEQVIRDMFYDGRAELEPGAIVCRVAPSFLRIGNYELFTSRDDLDTLRKLLDFTIETEFPHLGKPSKETYLKWFEEVCHRTATLVVHWMRVGFVHGVFNTDNTSVLGLTIDYGPYGWLDNYDPDWTPNTTDAQGKRYRFGAQPQIAQWNLLQLANALFPLIGSAKSLRDILNDYVDLYTQKWQQMRADKLGLLEYKPEIDEELNQQLNSLMQKTETDMTIFYRRLADISQSSQDLSDEALIEPLMEAYYSPEELDKELIEEIAVWIRSYQNRLRMQEVSDKDRKQAMNRVNPKYILRNYLSQLAIDKAHEGDYSMIHELLEMVKKPYDEQPEFEQYFEKRPDWARSKPGCSMLSCSS